MSKWKEISQEEFKRMVFDKSNVEIVDINVDPLHIKESMFGKNFKCIEITNSVGQIGSGYASSTTNLYYKLK